MKKTHTAIAILTGLAALAAAAQFSVSLAGPPPTVGSGLVTPTFSGLNIAATDGTTLSISTDKAEFSAVNAGNPFPVVFNDNLALAGGGGITALGQNVKFLDSVPPTGVNIDAQIPIANSAMLSDGVTGKPVLIADSEGLSIGPDATTSMLNINGQTGYISAPGINSGTGLPNPVTIADTAGLSVTNESGFAAFRIWGTNGDLEMPSASPVRIYDDEGLEIGDQAHNVRFKVDSKTGAITNPYPLPAGTDPIFLDDKVNITGNISNDTASTPLLVNDEIEVPINARIGTRLSSPGTNGYIIPYDNVGRTVIWNTYGTSQGMIFGTSNTERMRIAGGGYIGIGTTTPVAPLHINSAPPADANSGQLIITESTTPGNSLVLGRTQTYSFIQGHNNEPLALNPIANNVGIGTINPQAALDINGAGGFNVDLKVNGRITTGGSGGYGGVWVEDEAGKQLFMGADGSSIGFYNNGAWRLLINTSGNVGIGTASPSYKLDVAGSINSSSNITASGHIYAGAIGDFYVQTGDEYDTDNDGDPASPDCGTGTICDMYVYCDSSDYMVSVMPGSISSPGDGTHWSYVESHIWAGYAGHVRFLTDSRASAPNHQSVRALCFSPNG